MKKIIIPVLFLMLFLACTDKKEKNKLNENSETLLPFLPFSTIDLDQITSFKEMPKNWKMAGSVYADDSKEKIVVTSEGKGILVNIPNDQDKGHLFTAFEHGDIELEVDVMMPKGSNSGLFFQGRYEVQLIDSWGVAEPRYLDMGGIYHRWDNAMAEGNEAYEGYEGSAPMINAAKAPGLWQHIKIVFHAPRFDVQGNKVKNAQFESVWLNGVPIQENVELTGPTRASAFEDEKAMGSLMIQGDHGGVALKNLKYKLYNGENVTLTDMTIKEYPSDSVMLVNLDSLVPEREVRVDSISATMASGKNPQKILSFTGKMQVPETGEYLFDYRIHKNGGILIVDNDTIVNLDGSFPLDSIGVGTKMLNAGEVPFQLIYNKNRAWRQGFSLQVEGPNIQKHALHAPSSLDRTGFGAKGIIMLPVKDEVVLQRSFWMHQGKKRTHCIAVGTPQGVHYVYDLDRGALLQAWDGVFFDATELWLNRAEKQLGMPAGFTIAFQGDAQFATLTEDNDAWPKGDWGTSDFTSEGYTIDTDGLPIFNYNRETTEITDGLKPLSEIRALERSITFNGNSGLTHKLAEGNEIAALQDGSYIVNSESYFIKFTALGDLKPQVRKSNGKDELIIPVPSGTHSLTYTIIW
jgi:hypothetical protein